MMYQNKGYIGSKMSVRAKQAKMDYEVVLSDINLSLLEELDIKEQVNFMKFLMKRLGRSSWHHTGNTYNETDFYDLKRYFELSDQELEEFKMEFRSYQKQKRIRSKDHEFAIIRYVEWEGDFRNYKKPVEYIEECIVVGNWAHLLKGGKKNINGKHIKDVEYLGKRKPHKFNNKVVARLRKGLRL